MKKLIIHQYTNHTSKKFRYYNIFFDNLILELSKKHDVVVDRYRKLAHVGYNSVNFDIEELTNTELSLLECEMLIENITDNEIYILSVSDDLTQGILNLQSNPLVKKILVSQFLREKIDNHVSLENREKYFPWIYFPSNSFDFDFLYHKRKQKKDLIPKLYFRGSTSYRPIINFLDKSFFHGGDAIGGFESYVEELLNYSIALSIAGRGEFCYRDIECMAMGVPLLRFEYLSEMYVPLIPNQHYISVERPDDFKSYLNLDREGNQLHADNIITRFKEIYKDKEFLDYVSKNAKNYYDEYLSPNSSLDLTIKLLNL